MRRAFRLFALATALLLLAACSCPATPPTGSWIAFETPEERLALISPDGSRRVPLIEEGTVESFAWSPDGRWLAFIRGGQLTLLSLKDRIPNGSQAHLRWEVADG
jgi:Tol biopolymer transport system component